jgi:hypothetical protein
VRASMLTATLFVLAATSARAEFQICQHPFRPECSVSHVEYPCDVGWKQVMRHFDRRRDVQSPALILVPRTDPAAEWNLQLGCAWRC